MKTPFTSFVLTVYIIVFSICTNIFIFDFSFGKTNPVSKTSNASSKDGHSATYKLGEKLDTNAKSPKSTSFKVITWEDLIPNGWDPSADFKNMDLGAFNDADPRAISALKKLRSVWDNAPTHNNLNQKNIQIPGFVVPLDIENGKVAAFLLVPYFGGCLHTPPPPANQIIEVQLEHPQSLRTMEAVWVSGQIENSKSQTELGIAGYRLNAVKIIPYKEQKSR